VEELNFLPFFKGIFYGYGGLSEYKGQGVKNN